MLWVLIPMAQLLLALTTLLGHKFLVKVHKVIKEQLVPVVLKDITVFSTIQQLKATVVLLQPT